MAWVCHMEKYKANDSGGIGAEDDRASEKINEKNPNLDTELTHLNIHRMKTDGGYADTEYSHLAKIFGDKKRELNQVRAENGKTRIRKDAVVMGSFLISEDHSFFEGMTREEQIRFFETAVEWLNMEFGGNVLQYSIHFDEYTPHMHARVCPQDGDSLSAKKMFNPEALRKTQREFPEFMRAHGFDVGEPEHDVPTTHRKEAEQRIHALTEKVEKLEKQLSDKTFELDWLRHETEEWRTARKGIKGEYEDLKEEITSLKAQIRSNEAKIEEQERVLQDAEQRYLDYQSGCRSYEEVQELWEMLNGVKEHVEPYLPDFGEFMEKAERRGQVLQKAIQKAEEHHRQSASGRSHGKAVKRTGEEH